MPFKPRRLLLAYDPARGHCAVVVPRLKQMLEDRAFAVDVHEIGAGAVDLEEYDGLVLGTPMPGFGVRRDGPTQVVSDFVQALDDLDEKKVAIFCVYDVSPRNTFDRMKNLLIEKGADLVAEHAYWRHRPMSGEQILPAECMIRIR